MQHAPYQEGEGGEGEGGDGHHTDSARRQPRFLEGPAFGSEWGMLKCDGVGWFKGLGFLCVR